MVGLDPLARHGGGDGRARARRQRLRRGGCDRFHAPGRRAAPERPRRRGAGARSEPVSRGEPIGSLRPGRHSGRRHDRALPRARRRARPGHRRPRGLRPGRVRRLAAPAGSNSAPWRLEDVLEFAIGYAEHGFPFVAGIRATIERTEELLRSLAGLGTTSTCPCRRSGRALSQPRARRDLQADPRRGARRLPRGGDRRPGARGTRASSPRRSTGSSPAEGGLLTGDDMSRWRALARARRRRSSTGV